MSKRSTKKPRADDDGAGPAPGVAKKPRTDGGALEELWNRIEAEARRVVHGEGARPIVFPVGLDAPWLEEAEGALAVYEDPVKGRGFVAARDLPAGTTLTVTRPLVSHFNYEDAPSDDDGGDDGGGDDDGSGGDDDEGGEDKRGSTSGGEQGGSDDGSGEESDGGGVEVEPMGRFDLDEVDASLITKLARAIMLEAGAATGKTGKGAKSKAATGGAGGGGGGAQPLLAKVAALWPRAASELGAIGGLPPDLTSWTCTAGGGARGAEMAAALAALASVGGSGSYADLALRLPEVVRSNAHSMETGSELCCFGDPARGGLAPLSGLALYDAKATTFNHDCKPTVARYSLGVPVEALLVPPLKPPLACLCRHLAVSSVELFSCLIHHSLRRCCFHPSP